MKKVFEVLAAIAIVVLVVGVVINTITLERHTVEEAQSTPHAVVEVNAGIAVWDSEFTYTDNEFHQIPIGDCRFLLTKVTCESEDGNVVLEFRNQKGHMKEASVTVRGERIPLSCAYPTIAPWGQDVCVPTV